MLSPYKPASGVFPPVVHFHIPKTGGSSVHLAVQRALASEKAAVFPRVNDAEEARQLISDHRFIGTPLFISGHMSPLHLRTDGRFVRTAIVRDPVEHLISYFCYSFKTRYESREQLEFMRSCKGYREKRFSGADVERWVARWLGDNPQTRFLAVDGAGTADATAFGIARDALDGCDLVGTTDRMSVFLMMLGSIAGLSIGAEVHVNVSSHGIIDEAAESLRDRLRPYIGFDDQLYAHAVRRNANSPEWRAMLEQPPIPDLSEDASRLTLPERARYFLQASGYERRASIKRRVESVRSWIGDLKPVTRRL